MSNSTHRWAAQSHWNLQVALANLKPEEYVRYEKLLAEADYPESLTDRAAILERAVAHVASRALAERERGKTTEDHRRELFG